MDKYLKFVQKLDKKIKKSVIECWEKILSNDLGNLDIKKLTGFEDVFRVRIGKIRIIFKKEDNKNEVINIDLRKNIYRGL